MERYFQQSELVILNRNSEAMVNDALNRFIELVKVKQRHSRKEVQAW